MKKAINYKKASVYYLVGNLFNKGISFLTVPFFANLLSTSEYGIVSTFNSWVTILSMIFGFAIYMGIRASFIDYENNVDDVLAVSSTFTLISGLIISIIGIAILKRIDFEMGLYVGVFCCIQGLMAAIIQNYMMYLMMQYKYINRTLLMVLPNLLSASISIFIVYNMKENLYLGRIIPTTVIYFIIGIIVLICIYSKSRLLYNKEYLVYALKISMPLVLHGIALSILAQSDLTMITILADSSQAGIYSLIYNFSMIATVITTSLDGVWVPWFTAQMKSENKDEINVVAKDYISLITICLICVILMAPEVVKLLSPERYWEGIYIIPPIVIANFAVFAYTFYVNIEHYHKRTLYVTINTIVAAFTNLLLNYLFIPLYGYKAAAFTTLISYVVSFILHFIYAKRIEKELLNMIIFRKSIQEIILIVILFYFFIDFWYVRWGILFVYLVCSLLVNFKRIKLYLFRS